MDRLTRETLEPFAIRAAAGDRAAFQRIYSLTIDEIYEMMLDVADQADAEDLAFLVYTQAWRRARWYAREPSGYWDWLQRIARDVIRDYRRS